MIVGISAVGLAFVQPPEIILSPESQSKNAGTEFPPATNRIPPFRA